MRYYDPKRRDNPGDFFPMPKAVFRLGLDYGEIALLAFLMYCEDRKTFTCHPSYATIGSALGMSNNTVKKYVESRRPSGLRKTSVNYNSLAHRTTWLRSDLCDLSVVKSETEHSLRHRKEIAGVISAFRIVVSQGKSEAKRS